MMLLHADRRYLRTTFHHIAPLVCDASATDYFQSRRNDREEIRRRLALGADEDYYAGERAFRKPSLQTRLQDRMNLQICFVNAAADDDGDGDSGNVNGDASGDANSNTRCVAGDGLAASQSQVCGAPPYDV